jgi:hypothetical protein
VTYHTESANGGIEVVDPFFDTVDDADRYLEQQTVNGNEEYAKGFVLYDTRGGRIKEAVEVLTDQSDLGDFFDS